MNSDTRQLIRLTSVAVLICSISLVVCSADDNRVNVKGNIRFRGRLTNSRLQFERHKTGHVAFIGGSITEMNGYRPMVSEMLAKRFPNTEFRFTNAGISSTCSTTGAFRLQTDVLTKGPVDLLFVEFAVNDDQDAGHARRECIRGMEGIIRQVRRHNPNADIVITHFTNPGMVQTIHAGKTPLSSGSHEEVARHYNVSTIDLAKEVAEQIKSGKLTWNKYGGTHPKPFGNAMCAAMIERLLNLAWKTNLTDASKKPPHAMPDHPLDEGHYGRGHFIDLEMAQIASGWKLHVPQWNQLAGQCRRRFEKLALLFTTEPGAELKLKFRGRAIGAYVLAGPDAGIVTASIDGAEVKAVDLFHRFSKGLHYPRTVMFDADLEPGEHLLKLRMSHEQNRQSKGHAMRIIQFVVN